MRAKIIRTWGLAIAAPIVCVAATSDRPAPPLPSLANYRVTIVNKMVMHTKTGVSQRQLEAFDEMAAATNKVLSVPETVDICLFDWLRNQRLEQIVKAAGDTCLLQGEDNQRPDVDQIMTCTPEDASRPVETVALKGNQKDIMFDLSYTTTGGRENVGLQKVITGERLGPCE